MQRKNIVFILVMLVLMLISPLEVMAKQTIPDERLLPRVVDDGAILNDGEEAELLAKVDEISERQNSDVAVVTIESLEGKTAMEYADDYFDYNGYGMGEDKAGILLLVSMNDREWWMTTHGSAMTAYTQEGQKFLSEQFQPYLSDGEYAQGFTVFADWCDDYLTQAATGKPYGSGNMPKAAFPFLPRLGMALIFGIIVGLVVVTYMKSQLKSVVRQQAATQYEKQDSMHVTAHSDLFLYCNVSRRERPKESSGGGGSHTSSSGESHGGSGGSF